MEPNELIELAAEKKASDIHLTVGFPPVFRVYGSLQDVNK